MNNTIWNFFKFLQAEDISERISIFKLFGGYLFAFAIYYFALLFVNVTTPINEIYNIKLTNSGLALILSVITFIVITLLVGKKSKTNY